MDRKELFSLYSNNVSEYCDNNSMYYFEEGCKISPWHNIPYINLDGTINMICEIPRYTRKKYEIQTKINFNPIRQDEINGKPREYLYGDMLFNYGAIPQTWEDPKILCNSTMKYGDNDPLDIIDIGDYQSQVGMVYRVKVIGILALIDDDETDWKVIGININDPNCENIDTIDDVYYYKPGCLEAIKNWFEKYKTVRGKCKNSFAFNGEYKDMEYTKKVIKKCHEMWYNFFHKENEIPVI